MKNNINTHPKHGVLVPKAGEHKKTLEYAGAFLFIILLLFGGIMYLSSNNSNNIGKDNSAPAGTPITDTDNDSGTSGPDNSNDPGEATPVTETDKSPCPSRQVLNEETGECEPEGKIPEEVGPIGETGMDGPIETDFTKILFPYAETDEWGDNLEELSKINGHQPYYKFLSYSEEGEEKKFSFAVGYLEGCPDGCYFGDKAVCPKECLDEDNWREEKRFVMDEKYTLKDFGAGYGAYTGIFIKLDDPSYIVKNAQTYCRIKTNPLRLKECGGYRDFETETNYRIWIDRDGYENATVIVLP